MLIKEIIRSSSQKSNKSTSSGTNNASKTIKSQSKNQSSGQQKSIFKLTSFAKTVQSTYGKSNKDSAQKTQTGFVSNNNENRFKSDNLKKLEANDTKITKSSEDKDNKKGISIFSKLAKSTKENEKSTQSFSKTEAQLALDAIQEAKNKEEAKISDFTLCPIKASDSVEESDSVEMSTATVKLGAVTNPDTPEEIEIYTPFDTDTLESCIAKINELGFIQDTDTTTYKDRCLGMSAIYAAMLKSESLYFSDSDNGIQLVSDSDLSWVQIGDNFYLLNEGKTKAQKSSTDIMNSCKDFAKHFRWDYHDKNIEESEKSEHRYKDLDAMKEDVIGELNNGNPVIIQVSAGSKDSRHYATAIGTTKDGEVVVLDPYTGDCRIMDFSGTKPNQWYINHNGDRVPRKENGSYQIFIWKEFSEQVGEKV